MSQQNVHLFQMQLMQKWFRKKGILKGKGNVWIWNAKYILSSKQNLYLFLLIKFAHFRVNISTITQNNTFRTGFVFYYHIFTSYTKYFVSTRCELSYIKLYSFYNNKKPKTPFSHILMFVICNVFKPVPLNTCESGSQDT